jgi:hypothetical protein
MIWILLDWHIDLILPEDTSLVDVGMAPLNATPECCLECCLNVGMAPLDVA